MEGNLSLRIILLIIGALVIVGVFVWGVIQQRRGEYAPGRRTGVKPAGFRLRGRQKEVEPEPEEDYYPEPGHEQRIGDMADLRDLVSHDEDGLYEEIDAPPAPAKAKAPAKAPPAREAEPERGRERERAAERAERPADRTERERERPVERQTSIPVERQTSIPVERPAERPVERPASLPSASASGPTLISIHIVTRDGGLFTGKTILHKLQSVGMRFGEMRIFHHYGIGKRSQQPVFSLANLFEPGTFDPEELKTDAFRTRGFILFLRLPGPLDGSVALELLLSTAQRLANELDGVLLNDRREPLTNADLEQMRIISAGYSQGRK
jgi:cell division protein ZipA